MRSPVIFAVVCALCAGTASCKRKTVAATDGAGGFVPRNTESTMRGSGGIFTGGSNTEPRLSRAAYLSDRAIPGEPHDPNEPPSPFPGPSGFPGPSADTGPIQPLDP
jgi:hypothetical protein